MGAIWEGVKFATLIAGAQGLKKIDERWGKKFFSHTLAGMPGLPAKLQQFISMKMDGYDSNFSDLHVLTASEVKGIIASESPKLAESIELFEENGFSASLGQVHRARLKDGKEVAIKVMYPGVDKQIQDQLKVFLSLASKGPSKNYGLDIESYHSFLTEQFRRETDYQIEATEQMRFHEKWRDSSEVCIPKVYKNFSGQKVLVQDYEPSSQLQELKSESLGTREKIAKIYCTWFLKSLFIKRLVHTDPQPENWGFQLKNEKLVVYDFGSTLEIQQEVVDVLMSYILAYRKGRTVSALELFSKLGFSQDKVQFISFAIDGLAALLLKPITHDVDVREWNISGEVDRLLGPARWWFRTAGPPWFLFLMRTVFGMVHVVRELDVKVSMSSLFSEIEKEIEFSEVNIDTSISAPESPQEKSQSLKIQILEKGEEIVFLEMPAASVEDLENLVSPETRVKIEKGGHNLLEIKERVLSTGLKPQTLFESSVGERKYTVWLS